MIDSSKLQYNSKPYYKLRNYTVHPLNEQGFGEYLSKDSYVHKFMSIRKDTELIDQYLNITSDNVNNWKEKDIFIDPNNRNNKESNTTLKNIIEDSPREQLTLISKLPSHSTKVDHPINNLSNKTQETEKSKPKLKIKFVRDYKLTPLEELSHKTFNQINKNYLSQTSKGKFYKSIIGFRPDKVPRTIEDQSFISKEKWEISRIKRIEKMLFQSIALSKNNINKSQQSKEKIHSLMSLDIVSSSIELPKLKVKKKIEAVVDNKVNKFFGEKYNPFNYEVNKEKINTCSLKDSFKYKR